MKMSLPIHLGVYSILGTIALCCGVACADPIEASEHLTDKGDDPVQMLFIHHSCGGQLMADPGPQSGGESGSGARCIYEQHPNGGGLRQKLSDIGITVNEASYGSAIGQDTDICHWQKKFRDQMDDLLRTHRQDALLPSGLSNQIVAFKSCYPNNRFVGMGQAPGDADSCELTVANAKAAYQSLLPYFAQQPDVLFVAFTAPPMAEPKPRGFMAKLKSLFRGKPKFAELARVFNSWLVDEDQGWLASYETGNVVVFDYYDILTNTGDTNWSAYPTHEGLDSHPSRQGNELAANAFVTFIQDAMTHWKADKP